MSSKPKRKTTDSASTARQSATQRALLLNLRTCLKSKGINLQTAGDRLGWSPSTLCRQIQGKISVSGGRESQIRSYLGELRGPEGLREAAVAWVEALQPAQLQVLLHMVQFMEETNHPDGHRQRD